MIGKNLAELPNMRQRTILQHLSLDNWKRVDRLPIAAGELIVSRLLHHGWIECRGEKPLMEIRLTPAGLNAHAVSVEAIVTNAPAYSHHPP